ncbi:MAG: hypothetical protein KDC56_09525, partial [Flavobacteriaceae bacterium]|nr:hypothetical protein [Flavobacteriaceae bacterium]
MKKLVNYFLQGLLYIAPVGLTAYIIYAVFIFMDGILQQLVFKYFDIKVPGLGVLSLIVFIIIIGFLGRNFIA